MAEPDFRAVAGLHGVTLLRVPNVPRPVSLCRPTLGQAHSRGRAARFGASAGGGGWETSWQTGSRTAGMEHSVTTRAKVLPGSSILWPTRVSTHGPTASTQRKGLCRWARGRQAMAVRSLQLPVNLLAVFYHTATTTARPDFKEFSLQSGIETDLQPRRPLFLRHAIPAHLCNFCFWKTQRCGAATSARFQMNVPLSNPGQPRLGESGSSHSMGRPARPSFHRWSRPG